MQNTKTTIGISYTRSKNVDLWCRILSEVSGHTEFEVINGCWDGSIDASGTVKVHATGHIVPRCFICFKGVVPCNEFNYNEAMLWIDNFNDRAWIVKKYIVISGVIRGEVNRLRRACWAFKSSWNWEKDHQQKEDDTIPF